MDWLGNVHTRDESGISLGKTVNSASGSVDMNGLEVHTRNQSAISPGKTVNSASGSVVDMNEEASPTHKESEWC